MKSLIFEDIWVQEWKLWVVIRSIASVLEREEELSKYSGQHQPIYMLH